MCINFLLSFNNLAGQGQACQTQDTGSSFGQLPATRALGIFDAWAWGQTDRLHLVVCKTLEISVQSQRLSCLI